MNLLSNSYRFTYSGEIEIKVSIVEQNVIRILVRDTGLGMTELEESRLRLMLDKGIVENSISNHSVGI